MTEKKGGKVTTGKIEKKQVTIKNDREKGEKGVYLKVKKQKKQVTIKK